MAARHFKSEPARFGGGGATAPRSSRPVRKRPFVIGALALAVVGVAVAGVVAWLTATGQVNNQFKLGVVDPTVEETFEKNVKSDVRISVGESNVPIYIRARVDIYWVDANGNQMWEQPAKDVDYTLTQSLVDKNWVLGSDGLYYWTKPLQPREATENLIDKLSEIANTHGDGRTLVCDVSAQGIQAEPSHAVEEAWGVTVKSDGTLDVTTKEGE